MNGRILELFHVFLLIYHNALNISDQINLRELIRDERVHFNSAIGCNVVNYRGFCSTSLSDPQHGPGGEHSSLCGTWKQRNTWDFCGWGLETSPQPRSRGSQRGLFLLDFDWRRHSCQLVHEFTSESGDKKWKALKCFNDCDILSYDDVYI